MRREGRTEELGRTIQFKPNQDKIFEALVWLANDLSRRGFGLRQGDAVTTGTVAGVHYAEAGMRVVADFGALGKAEVTFTP